VVRSFRPSRFLIIVQSTLCFDAILPIPIVVLSSCKEAGGEPFFEKLLSINRPLGTRELRLWFILDELGNIGSELLGMTLLQQQNRVQRSAKKAVAHQREDDLVHGTLAHASVDGVKPRFV